MKLAILSVIAAMGIGFCAPAMGQNEPSKDRAKAAAEEQASNAAKAAVVQRHVDAYRARDLDRFIATFAPDAEVHANGLIAVGHDQIRAFYKLNFAPNAPRIVIKNSGMSGPYVYLAVAFITGDGEELCCSHSEYEVTDGRITFLTSST